MSINVSDNKKEFPKHPEGVFQAVCCDCVDLGMEKTVFDGVEKMQRKIRVYFRRRRRNRGGPALHHRQEVHRILE